MDPWAPFPFPDHQFAVQYPRTARVYTGHISHGTVVDITAGIDSIARLAAPHSHVAEGPTPGFVDGRIRIDVDCPGREVPPRILHEVVAEDDVLIRKYVERRR